LLNETVGQHHSKFPMEPPLSDNLSDMIGRISSL
jgi:hypothetical protein